MFNMYWASLKTDQLDCQALECQAVMIYCYLATLTGHKQINIGDKITRYPRLHPVIYWWI